MPMVAHVIKAPNCNITIGKATDAARRVAQGIQNIQTTGKATPNATPIQSESLKKQTGNTKAASHATINNEN